MTLAGFVAVSVLAALGLQQERESSSCQSDIVSSTVVSSFCGHHEGEAQVLDLLILWRGTPGWFHGKSTGRRGGGGSRVVGGTKGIVSQSTYYGDVAIAFEANFDSRVANVAQSTVKLDHVNTIVADNIDGNWRITGTRWTDPRLPLVGDWNLALARRSPEFVRDLRCEIPMPASPPLPQLGILTVCDKLKTR